MKTVNLIITKTYNGQPVRFQYEVSEEVAERYLQIMKEYPELTEMEAFKKANENL